jgi:hypothetical protein
MTFSMVVESRLEGGVNRQSLKINPASIYSNRETETLCQTMSGWVGQCPAGSDYVRSGQTMSSRWFQVGYKSHATFQLRKELSYMI